MTTQDKEKLELLQGTLDLLILRTLIFGPRHGQGIARAIQETSEEELLVEHGALYPALQRLEDRGWISGFFGSRAAVHAGTATSESAYARPVRP